MAYLSRAKLKFEAFCYFITYTNIQYVYLNIYFIFIAEIHMQTFRRHRQLWKGV